MLKRGYLQFGKLGGIPLQIHWTTPLGAVLFTGLKLEPLLWLGFIGLVIVHELGHAAMVRLAGAHTTAIELSGAGGKCRYQGTTTPIGRAVIGWGGVGAQLLVLGAALAIEAVSPLWLPAWAYGLLTRTNCWLIAFNLIPAESLDGLEAWKLPWLLGRAARRRLPSFRIVRTLGNDEDAAMDHSKLGAEAKELAASLLKAAREGEQQEHEP